MNNVSAQSIKSIHPFFTWTMRKAIDDYKYRFSMHPVLFGEAFANLEFCCFFSSVIEALLGTWYDRISVNKNDLSIVKIVL